MAIVCDRLALHRFFGQLPRELERPLVAGQHADLQRRQRPAGVAVADFGQELRARRRAGGPRAGPARAACPPGAAHQRLDVVGRQRLELKDPAAADQRAVDREERILGGRADQGHDALFDVRQQHVLLGLVEAVDLVDEQQRPASAGGQLVAGVGQHFAQFLHAAGHGAELPELAVALRGQQAGQRRLARARRAVEDHRAQPIGLQQPPQQLALAQEMLLADELVERRRPHPRRQRLSPPQVVGFGSFKQRLRRHLHLLDVANHDPAALDLDDPHLAAAFHKVAVGQHIQVAVPESGFAGGPQRRQGHAPIADVDAVRIVGGQHGQRLVGVRRRPRRGARRPAQPAAEPGG